MKILLQLFLFFHIRVTAYALTSENNSWVTATLVQEATATQSR